MKQGLVFAFLLLSFFGSAQHHWQNQFCGQPTLDKADSLHWNGMLNQSTRYIDSLAYRDTSALYTVYFVHWTMSYIEDYFYFDVPNDSTLQYEGYSGINKTKAPKGILDSLKASQNQFVVNKCYDGLSDGGFITLYYQKSRLIAACVTAYHRKKVLVQANPFINISQTLFFTTRNL